MLTVDRSTTWFQKGAQLSDGGLGGDVYLATIQVLGLEGPLSEPSPAIRFHPQGDARRGLKIPAEFNAKILYAKRQARWGINSFRGPESPPARRGEFSVGY
jgi:hypothetical protein